MTEIFLLLIFSFLLGFYTYFILSIYRGLRNLKKSDEDKLIPEFVSIIIPFRNERENLPSNLKSLESQDYPKNKYEVIYVNDSSTDDSAEILVSRIKNENIKVIAVPGTYIPNAHKKRAIKYGIENAKGEIIITSDADCNYNTDWLKTLLKYMDDETAFISGPVEFEDSENIFGAIQKLEFAGLVIVGAGLIGVNRPTICNAANIAYRKKVFDEVDGFYGQYGLSSGDDELLMQKIWKRTKYKIKFCPEKKAIVKTVPNKSLSEFYQQRKRWASKGLFYGDKLLVLKLILIYLFYLGLAVQLILGMSKSPVYFITLTVSLLFKIIIEYLAIKKGIDLLFDRRIVRLFLPAQILHIPYIILAGFSGIFGNFTWKDRMVSR
jgi:cellulose synthase/poly-beta-1,6-N-acetylglucosamine synthase-like glycosyltransferase